MHKLKRDMHYDLQLISKLIIIEPIGFPQLVPAKYMMLTLILLAVHLCKGFDIICYTDLFTSSLIFTLLHYELVERLLKFHDRGKQVFIIFLSF